jgi:hypothetical protein
MEFIEEDSKNVVDRASEQLPFDKGGAIVPKLDCPHLEACALSNKANVLNKLSSLPLGLVTPCKDCGDDKENWICLKCSDVFCSRYRNEHGLEHFIAHIENKPEDQHNVALSFSDLTIWCYICNEYVKDPRLVDFLVKAESVKFGTPEKTHLLEDGSDNGKESAGDGHLKGIAEDDKEEEEGEGF